MQETTSPYIVVKKSKIDGRRGVFAKTDIPKGEKIIEYVGEKLTKKQAEERAEKQLERAEKEKSEGHVYLFEINSRYDIDGNVPYNTARLINHSCDPNAETDNINGRIWILSRKPIKKGEEITYDYGFGWEEYEDHPCYCGSHNCVGYILHKKHHGKLRKKLKYEKSKTKKRQSSSSA